MRKSAKLIVLLALLPGVAMAVNFLSMQDLPVYYMTDEDKVILKSAIIETLEHNRDGEGAHWENQKTGAHGDLNPRASFKRGAQPCRELEVANSARGHDNRMVLTLCRQDDGDWKVDRQ